MKINTRSLRKAGALLLITEAILFAMATSAHAQSAGVVAAGQATINQNGAYTTINQSSANVIINWQSFNIAVGETVQFVQPGSNSVALNRVLGADPSVIMGTLTANGTVFLLNPNGVLFGNGSSVSVGGLVASTMNITDANFMAGNYAFTDAGAGSVINQGNISVSDGGNVALMGRTVNNQGVISARLGTVNLVGAQAVTLDIAGDGLLNVSVSQGAVNALVQNGGLIQADGGRVLMTAQAAGNLLDTVVNNTGVIQARTIENRNGTILLLGDMQSGSMNVGGVLDASAPNGGNGGFIETSAANVSVSSDARITTAAANGNTGQWLIDPTDFVIGSAPGNNIAGSTLSAQLVNNNITINTASALTQAGNITVNDAVTWSAAGAPTTLTLIADANVNINAAITATNGNLDVCCGQDINVNAAITTTNGSVRLSAGNNVNQTGAITVTDGNLMICAANDVNIAGAITLTNGTNDPTRSLGLPRGLTLSADTDGTGPGIEGGTVRFDALAPPIAVTNAPVAVYYNPVSYDTPTVYTTNFTLTGGATLASYMLVFAAGGDRAFDGTTTTTLTGLIGNPVGVSLVAGPGASANFGSVAIGNNQAITYTGYTLAGPNASSYALALNCCGPVLAHTTGSITSSPGTTTPGNTPPGLTPSTPVTWIPGPIGSLVTVEEDNLPTNTLEITQIEEVQPYVAPYFAPVPYRN